MADGWSDSEIADGIRRLVGGPTCEREPAPAPRTPPPRHPLLRRTTPEKVSQPTVTDAFAKDVRANKINTNRHIASCLKGPTTCARCRLARCFRKRWSKITNIDVAVPCTWLETEAFDDPEWSVGCKICRWAYDPNGLATGGVWTRLAVADACVQKANLIRHGRSTAHRAACVRFLAAFTQSPSLSLFDPSAPGVPQFLDVLRSVRAGHVLEKGQLRAMAWCLYEALKDEERKFLSNAMCATLAQDARAGCLLTRWVACGRDLSVRAGVLQLHRGKAAGAVNLHTLTCKGITAIATCRRHGGGKTWAPRVRPRLDARLQTHVANIVEVFVADGAADEQLAGQMLLPTSTSEHALPNLKMVCRDRAHASRRLLQRTWDKDDYIRGILGPLLWDEQSLVRLLQTSDVFADLFRDVQTQELEVAPTAQPAVQNMSYAKQRFDSFFKPLQRLVRHFGAAILAAADFVANRPRTDRPAQGAARALGVITNECALQLAMLADAAECSLRLTRFLDCETFDLAKLPDALDTFCRDCEYLFEGGGCFTYEGHTWYMENKVLSRRILFFLSPAEPRTVGVDVGGLPPDVRQRCLARMVNWLRLAKAVLSAEFPGWDLLRTFAAFALDVPSEAAPRAPTSMTNLEFEAHAALSVWAARLDLDVEALVEQFLALRPVACSYYRKNGGDTSGAWRRAVQETQSTAQRRRHYEVSEILPLLWRYMAYSGSTSGVEQAFSRQKKLMGEQRNLTPHNEEILLCLGITSADPVRDAALAAAARGVWMAAFGPPRAPRRPGLPEAGRIQRAARVSERAMAQTRAERLRLAAGGPGETETAIAAKRKAAKMWGARQEKELGARVELAKRRRLDAALQGTLARPAQDLEPGEISDHRRKARQAEGAVLRRHAIFRARGQPRDLAAGLGPGTRVFLQDEVRHSGLQLALSRNRWRAVNDRVLAEVFVVVDPARPDPRDAFVAALGGRLLVSPKFLLEPGAGAAVRYDRALRLPRYIWVSPACSAKFGNALDVMRRLVAFSGSDGAPKSRWRWDTLDEFLVRRNGRGVRGASELVALVLPAEVDAPSLRHVPNRTTVMDFVRRCAKINPDGCQVGACKR